MKKYLITMSVFLSFNATIVMAEEGVNCGYWHSNVQRKVENIKSYGSNLSRMAKDRLFSDLESDTGSCLSQCEGSKFKYCNDIAKWIEEY